MMQQVIDKMIQYVDDKMEEERKLMDEKYAKFENKVMQNVSNVVDTKIKAIE